MVKIKTEKKMNLAELIQYIIENNVKDRAFTSQGNDEIIVNAKGEISISYNRHVGYYCDNTVESVQSTTTFLVNTEEEITEETRVTELLEIFRKSSGGMNVLIYGDASIKDVCDEYKDALSYHMVNPDGTTTLLWTKEGGMVE